MLKVINLFGGANTGKSTLAAEVFARMKKSGYSVELVTEFAKDLVWEERHSAFSDQLYILGNQNRRLTRLVGKVEWAITDCPILLSLAYVPAYYLPNYFRELVTEVEDMYENHNFLLLREFEFQNNGRIGDEKSAMQVDSTIVTLLDSMNRPYTVVSGGERVDVVMDALPKRVK